MSSKIILSLICLSFLFGCSIYYQEKSNNPIPSEPEFNVSIPIAGNSWLIKNGNYTSSDLISTEGIRNWDNPSHTIRTFFYLEKAGQISLGIRAQVYGGISKVKITFGNKSRNVTIEENGMKDIFIGNFQVDQPGYYFMDISGLEKTGSVYADVNDVLLGNLNPNETKYIKDDFYFGRRGPSVHLNFEIPNGVDQVEWFYSELVVPKNQDVIGSYFMANGFGEGYFGIQVNSAFERKILFSIWSPYQTDNPNEIPEDYKVKLLKKGEGVTTGEFGNEGSGGQSFKVYDWKTDVPYGFLIGAKPTINNHTDYTAYFYDPQIKQWSLIAQFRRPKTTTYLKHLYSFLENFIPDQGVIERKGLYQNQWIYSNSSWHELTKITFTADNTARKEYRLDYSGGLENDGFYLKNCGFSNDKVNIDSKFERTRLSIEPVIDFSILE